LRVTHSGIQADCRQPVRPLRRIEYLSGRGQHPESAED
jgi:hypothetical protein